MVNIRFDWVTFFCAVTASCIGVLVLYSGGGSGEAQAYKKIVWLIVGILVMIFLRFVNYQVYGSYSLLFYLLTIFLLLITLVPFIGYKVKGARSWLKLAGFGFQPAEFAKITLVFIIAKYLTLREKEISQSKELIIPFTITMIPMGLIAVQPDLGYSMMLLPLVFLMLFVGGANSFLLLALYLIGFCAVFVPMYIEYHKFIIVDDIRIALAQSNYKLADAVQILNFDSWQYIDRPNLAQKTKHISDNLTQWAIKTITIPENIAQFKKVANTIMKEESNIIRDFFRSPWSVGITLGVFILGYISSLALFIISSKGYLKQISKFFLILILSLGSALVVHKFFHFKTHQIIRIVSFANPDKFQKGAGYQLRHSLITLGSGQVTGKGLFNGDMTKGDVPFLPEWYNDFIFSVIGEQLGLIGTVFTLLILMGIILRGISIAIQSKDDFGSLLAMGLTAILFLHIFINVGINLGLMPVTGIPLIFISAGGSNMISSFVIIGILMNIHARRFIN